MTAEVRFDDRGLVAAIVQDAATSRVLMLGWMNRHALELTTSSGLVHFFSRSRQELWKKGETSGNTLALVDLAIDCDGDAVLVRAEPAGPTCHTGSTSCFDGDEARPLQGFAGLEPLWRVIASRAQERPAGSYTTTLLDGGVDMAGRKVTEEATEVLLAAKDHAAGTADETRLAEEAADLVYHVLVLLAERGVAPALVLEELANRAT